MRLYQKNILARCERPFFDVCTFIVNFIKDLSFSFILFFICIRYIMRQNINVEMWAVLSFISIINMLLLLSMVNVFIAFNIVGLKIKWFSTSRRNITAKFI